MVQIYFLLMKMSSSTGSVHQWAYLRCMRKMMKDDPIMGYFRFAERYFSL